MKRLLLIFIPLLMLGGGAFAMWKLGIPPFPKHAKPPKAAKQKDPPPTIAEATPESPPSSPTSTAETSHKPQTAKPATAMPADAAAADRKVARLTDVYESMPAEDAARIVAKLPDPLVEQILRRMDERQAGKLLVILPVDRAAKLTQALAK